MGGTLAGTPRDLKRRTSGFCHDQRENENASPVKAGEALSRRGLTGKTRAGRPRTGKGKFVRREKNFAHTDDTARRPDDYRAHLANAERAAETLRLRLHTTPPDPAFQVVGQNCAACHKIFRNERK